MELEPAEAEVLAREVRAFALALADPAARSRFETLATAVEATLVPDELVGSLETMLELVFEKGRPSNRAVMQSIYARTPRGRQLTRAAREVNDAFETLRGQRLEQLRVSAAPASHTL